MINELLIDLNKVEEELDGLLKIKNPNSMTKERLYELRIKQKSLENEIYRYASYYAIENKRCQLPHPETYHHYNPFQKENDETQRSFDNILEKAEHLLEIGKPEKSYELLKENGLEVIPKELEGIIG